ncbi:MAG: NUDIX domain-containing protein [Desulfobacteraceae bacterium]|nr:NUDIX domain-containing protein [Desulfobacteraceae bacterium]
MKNNGIERPVLSVDVVVFSIYDGHIRVLMSRREKEPFKGAPALPGAAVQIDETLLAAARRALAEKTGFTLTVNEEIYLDQLATFDALYRDPRGRTVSVAYMGITRVKPENSEKMIWKKVSDISKGGLPFDHDYIVETAVARLKGKLRYTNIAKGFLPDTFRIEELQDVYEAILKCSLNRTNFRNKLLKIGLIEQISILTEAVGKKGGRPPHLYRFTQELIEAVDRDFL